MYWIAHAFTKVKTRFYSWMGYSRKTMTHTSHAFEIVIPSNREKDSLAKKLHDISRQNSKNILQLSNKGDALIISLSPKENNIIETYSLALSIMETYKNIKPILYSRNYQLGLEKVAVVENDSVHIVNTPCI